MALKRGQLLKDIGAPGTEITGGSISGVDHNADFDGTENIRYRCEVYDEMLQSDAQVFATYQAVELPITQSEFVVRNGDPDGSDEPIRQFVDDNFQGMSHTFTDFIRHAVMSTVYGLMPFEKVMKIIDGKYHIKKLSPRLPRTIMKWNTDPEDQGIISISQEIIKGGRGRIVDIPIKKLAIFINRQIGVNYEGWSILRSAYKHFYYKNETYRFDVMGHERFGVGTPIAEAPKSIGPGHKQYIEMQSILEGFRANEYGYIIYPYGWKVQILERKAGNSGMLETIKHHDLMISRNVLAQFLNLGSTESGSRSLSDSFSKLFMLSLQALANYICDVTNKFIIKPLVDLNFANVTKYPYLVCPSLKEDLNIDALLTGLSQLAGSGLLVPDDNLRQWVRELLTAPPEEEKEVEQKEKIEDLKNTKKQKDAEKELIEADKRIYPIPTLLDDNPYWRPLRPVESYIALSEIDQSLDKLEAIFLKELEPIRKKQTRSLLNDMQSLNLIDHPEKLAQLQIKFKQKLISTGLKTLKRVANFGNIQVESERNRQQGKIPVSLDVIVNNPGMPPYLRKGEPWTGRQKLVDWLRARLYGYATDQENILLAQIREVVYSGIRTGLTDNSIIDDIEKRLAKDLYLASPSYGRFLIMEAFNLGREEAMRKYEKEVKYVEYSAILDGKVCEKCRPLDGKRFQVGSDEYNAYKPPNFHCESRKSGGNKCRCIYAFIFNDQIEDTEAANISYTQDELREIAREMDS